MAAFLLATRSRINGLAFRLTRIHQATSNGSCAGSLRCISFRSSADTTGDDAFESAKKILQSPAKKNLPKALFPWRHDVTLPERLLQRKANFRSSYISFDLHAYYISLLTAKLYLKLPWRKVLSTSWSSELADACAWAFMQGVSGIVSNVYNVPSDVHSPSTSQFDIDFTYVHDSEETAARSRGSSQQSTEIKMDSTLDEKLIELYRSAHRCGKDQIEVRLQTRPIGARIYSLHSLPMISRAIAQEDPCRLEEYAILRDPANRSITASNKFLNRMLEERGKLESTLFADVLVDCEEVFRVTDLETGTLLQGYADEKIRTVVHSIRLEQVIPWIPGEGAGTGTWKIIDIDDLLDGNTWYSPPVDDWWLKG